MSGERGAGDRARPRTDGPGVRGAAPSRLAGSAVRGGPAVGEGSGRLAGRKARPVARMSVRMQPPGAGGEAGPEVANHGSSRAEAAAPLRYRRVVVKMSGEVLAGSGGGIDTQVVSRVCGELAAVSRLGVQVAVVVGGGNIWRGSVGESWGMDRATADYMGMLAITINALALQDMLERRYGVTTRVQTAIEMRAIAEPYIRRRAIRHLEKGRVVIFAAGTGNPFFTTDTAAALRAAEIEAEVMFKATREEGVYDADPRQEKDARLLGRLTYLDVLQRGLKVMDATAVSLCMENHIPIIVFDMRKEGAIVDAVSGREIGTLVADPD